MNATYISVNDKGELFADPYLDACYRRTVKVVPFPEMTTSFDPMTFLDDGHSEEFAAAQVTHEKNVQNAMNELIRAGEALTRG